MQAFDEAWRLFKKNWLISIETALLILLGLIIFSMIIIFLLGLLQLIVVFFALSVASASLAFNLIIYTGLAITLAILVVAIMMFTTFYLAVWTDIFTRIDREPHYSKIHRSVRHLPWLHKKIV